MPSEGKAPDAGRSRWSPGCPRLCFILLVLLAVGPSGHAQDLLVLSKGNDSVIRYDGVSGGYLGIFVPGLIDPTRLLVDPDQNLLIADYGNDRILKVDGQSGALVGELVTPGSGGLNGPVAMAIGSSGTVLHVLSQLTNSILEYDLSTGGFLGVFVSTGSGGMIYPTDMTVGPDGKYYMSDLFSSQVFRADSVTGAMDVFVPSAGSGGLSGGSGLIFGTDGSLFVSSSSTDSVIRFDGNDGSLVGTFIPPGIGGLDNPRGLGFQPSTGHLLVASQASHSVKRYDGVTGAYIDNFAFSGLLQPEGVGFVPQLAFTDLGSGLAGIQGIPQFVGSGALAAGSSGSLSLTSANASSPALLFVSLASVPAAFKGGVLLAFPFTLVVALATDGNGELLLPFVWPLGVPAATSLYFQYAIQDAAGPQGASLSNALKGVTP